MDYSKYYEKTTISVSVYTKETLKSMKKDGDTYDGLLQMLIEFWDKNNSQYWIRRGTSRTEGSANINTSQA